MIHFLSVAFNLVMAFEARPLPSVIAEGKLSGCG